MSVLFSPQLIRPARDQIRPGLQSPVSILRHDHEDGNNVIQEETQEQPKKQQGRETRGQKLRKRRRRRSSARFLRLTTGRSLLEEDDDGENKDNEDDDEEEAENFASLGEMYKKAIRLNAENRINATNSWSLNLIDNIDKFLDEEHCDDEEDEKNNKNNKNSKSPGSDKDANSYNDDNSSTKAQNKKKNRVETSSRKRINFTKASCTLDASVKIYSYRVDDVHLTSYKVLANLNRTDTNKKKKNGRRSSMMVTTTDDREEANNTNDYDIDDDNDEDKKHTRTKSTNTLESNVANINLSSMDSAFDIDPLFHKMSKTFDEGGAKGLLLVNLGVGSKGCNVVFDSKQDEQEEVLDGNDDDDNNEDNNDGMVDISFFKTKLDNAIAGQSMESQTLVPQLADLRTQYAELDNDGFVEEIVPIPRTQRYAVPEEEEKVADVSIHQEALERSRVSQGGLGTSFYTDQDGDSQSGFGMEDYGGDDNDNNSLLFGSFIQEGGERYSGISFCPSFSSYGDKTQATMLDAICSGNVLDWNNDFEYFSAKALENFSSGNGWAGSQHWKRSDEVRRTRKPKENKKKKTCKTPSKKEKRTPLIDLSSKPNLQDALRQPPKKNKRGANPLQIGKTTLERHSKTDHLLPPDAGIDIKKLSSLFLKPGDVLLPTKHESRPKKVVGFAENLADEYAGDWDDGSFGGNVDDGTGFAFAEQESKYDDEFEIQELEGVRKVEKVDVGYATVAKKVDVKRLKRDLWVELESVFASNNGNSADEETDDIVENTAHDEGTKKQSLSFQDTVREMEASKSQPDITLPFYFICILHLANERGLQLDSKGLEDFIIYGD